MTVRTPSTRVTCSGSPLSSVTSSRAGPSAATTLTVPSMVRTWSVRTVSSMVILSGPSTVHWLMSAASR